MRFLLISVFLVVFFAVQASGRTWYIKADGTGDAPTIQAGVDSTADGDTVLVAGGVYNESISVERTRIYLISEGGPDVTIIQGDPGAWSIRSLRCVRVEGFTVRGASIGIAYFNTGDIIGNVVRDCEISAILFGGMDVDIHPTGTIQGNIVCDSPTGIEISGAIGYGTYLIGNTVYGCETGLHIFNPMGSAAIVTCNLVTGCTSAGVFQAVDCSSYPCGPPPELACNIVWGNQRDYVGTEPGQTDMVVCPKLCRADEGDFRVCYDSPCLPENNPYGCSVGACGAGCECGPSSVEQTTWGAIKAMYK